MHDAMPDADEAMLRQVHAQEIDQMQECAFVPQACALAPRLLAQHGSGGGPGDEARRVVEALALAARQQIE